MVTDASQRLEFAQGYDDWEVSKRVGVRVIKRLRIRARVRLKLGCRPEGHQQGIGGPPQARTPARHRCATTSKDTSKA